MIALSKNLGLIAGDGELPVKFSEIALKNGFKVVTISLSVTNRSQLQKNSNKLYAYGPGEIEKILNTLKQEGVNQITFIGKVNKSMLFRNPKLDSRAIKLLREAKKLNDDAVMLKLVEELDNEGIEVVDQTIFLKEIMPTKGLLGNIRPDESQEKDIEYGFFLAKEMGKLDIGQSVVVQNKMILAVEAIEGTDKAIARGCKLGNGNAVVVKVSKPAQDKRFDVPTVGLNTLKTMKRYGGKVLAIESNETFVVEKEAMIRYADKQKMVLIAV